MLPAEGAIAVSKLSYCMTNPLGNVAAAVTHTHNAMLHKICPHFLAPHNPVLVYSPTSASLQLPAPAPPSSHSASQPPSSQQAAASRRKTPDLQPADDCRPLPDDHHHHQQRTRCLLPGQVSCSYIKPISSLKPSVQRHTHGRPPESRPILPRWVFQHQHHHHAHTPADKCTHRWLLQPHPLHISTPCHVLIHGDSTSSHVIG